MNRAEEIADVEDPDDVVEGAAVHRVARVRRVDDGAQRLLGRHVGGDSDDVRARHHHGGDLLRREVEDLVEHLLLGLLELAHVLGRGHRVANVLSGVRDHPGRRRVDAQEPEDEVRRHLQEPHDRVGDAAEEVERDSENDRQPLGFLQRNRLRHELAEHDREVGQDGEGDEEAHRH